MLRQLFRSSAAVRTVAASRSLTTTSAVQGAHAPAVPKTTLVDALKKRIPGQEDAVAKRLEQLKRNHSTSTVLP